MKIVKHNRIEAGGTQGMTSRSQLVGDVLRLTEEPSNWEVILFQILKLHLQLKEARLRRCTEGLIEGEPNIPS